MQLYEDGTPFGSELERENFYDAVLLIKEHDKI